MFNMGMAVYINFREAEYAGVSFGGEQTVLFAYSIYLLCFVTPFLLVL
jgi:hypothetical protein